MGAAAKRLKHGISVEVFISQDLCRHAIDGGSQGLSLRRAQSFERGEVGADQEKRGFDTREWHRDLSFHAKPSAARVRFPWPPVAFFRVVVEAVVGTQGPDEPHVGAAFDHCSGETARGVRAFGKAGNRVMDSPEVPPEYVFRAPATGETNVDADDGVGAVGCPLDRYEVLLDVQPHRPPAFENPAGSLGKVRKKLRVLLGEGPVDPGEDCLMGTALPFGRAVYA